MKQKIVKELTVPEGVTVETAGLNVKVSGPKGSLERRFKLTRVDIALKDNTLIISSENGTKREKTKIGTTTAHLKNMLKGVVEPFTYTLKICSGHFPMNVSLNGQELVVKNFLGEKVPRSVTLPTGTEAKVDGDQITVSSPDIELAGQAASRIEQVTRITQRDRRIFQDGIYITNKCGKAIK